MLSRSFDFPETSTKENRFDETTEAKEIHAMSNGRSRIHMSAQETVLKVRDIEKTAQRASQQSAVLLRFNRDFRAMRLEYMELFTIED